jgi:hypothetical protein
MALADIAHARSGDKGDRADLSLFATDAETFAILVREVTPERVSAHFADIGFESIDAYRLDNLWALKFVLNGALQGGGARSLRSDNLGKTLAARLLRMEVRA